MIDVCVLLLDDNYATTAVLPTEVFHCAGLLWNAMSQDPPDPRFRVTTASLDGAAVSSPYSMGLSPQVPIASIERTDLVIVPAAGWGLKARLVRDARIFPWLQKQAAQGAHIAAICTGVVYLAEAGLLDGRQATVHWAVADEYRRRYPKVDWHPEKFITEDNRILTSSGIYAAIDLSLHLVEKFCGRELAQQCAKAMRVNMPRGNQSGYALLTLSRPHNDERIHAAEAYMERNYASDVSTTSLAAHVNMSPRNFVRRFKQATGRLPGNYLQALRIAVAKAMLEDGARSVQAVSTAVGYQDLAFFRAIFKRSTGMTPSEYRQSSAGIIRVTDGGAAGEGGRAHASAVAHTLPQRSIPRRQ
jgi:transcriptional regulator GlxA family with amidase domain